jgi:hypothetical protein
LENFDPCVKKNVLPLVDGGEYVVLPDLLRSKLTEWLATFGDTRIQLLSIPASTSIFSAQHLESGLRTLTNRPFFLPGERLQKPARRFSE